MDVWLDVASSEFTADSDRFAAGKACSPVAALARDCFSRAYSSIATSCEIMMRKIPLLAALGTILLSACSDIQHPTTVSPPSSEPALAKSKEKDKAKKKTGTVIVKKDGKYKAYRVKVDEGTNTIELLSQCMPEDPGCVEGIPESSLTVFGQYAIGNIYADGTAAPCPARQQGEWWIDVEGSEVIMRGEMQKIRDLRVWPWGEAEYRIPPGPWTSDDGKLVVWSGKVRMKCYGVNTRGGFEGLFTSYWLSGKIERKQANGGGGDVHWTATDVEGVGGDAQAVINKFLNSGGGIGGCTPGWVIEVDGARVC